MEFFKEYTFVCGFVPHSEFGSFEWGKMEFMEKFEARFPNAKYLNVEWEHKGFYVEFRIYETKQWTF